MGQDDYKWKVCVRCYTFNQAPYIEDAMNGFTMQQTDFPFVCCIVDDASSDGEQEVIQKYVAENFDFDDSDSSYIEEKEYGKLIFARHNTNHNCYFAVVFLEENHNSSPERKARKRSLISKWENNCKYEAICEGDDYWTCSYKLHKQVEFLDSHPDFAMCFHQVDIRVESGCDLSSNEFVNIDNKEYSSSEILNSWTVPTCSVMFVRRVLSERPVNSKFTYGDNILWLTCARIGKIQGIIDKMGVYRRLPTGWMAQDKQTLIKKHLSQLEGIRESFPELPKGLINDLILDNIISWIIIKIKKRSSPTEALKKAKLLLGNKYLKEIIKRLLNIIVERRFQNQQSYKI